METRRDCTPSFEFAGADGDDITTFFVESFAGLAWSGDGWALMNAGVVDLGCDYEEFALLTTCHHLPCFYSG